jgi:hypothetical protein
MDPSCLARLSVQRHASVAAAAVVVVVVVVVVA